MLTFELSYCLIFFYIYLIFIYLYNAVSYSSQIMSVTGKTLSPKLMFHNAASNIICQVLFGTRYEYEDPFIKVIVQCFTENSKLANGPWAMVSQSVFLTTLALFI